MGQGLGTLFGLITAFALTFMVLTFGYHMPNDIIASTIEELTSRESRDQARDSVVVALATLAEGGFNGWIMIDAWEVPDPYDASLKGKRAIDRALSGM